MQLTLFVITLLWGLGCSWYSVYHGFTNITTRTKANSNLRKLYPHLTYQHNRGIFFRKKQKNILSANRLTIKNSSFTMHTVWRILNKQRTSELWRAALSTIKKTLNALASHKTGVLFDNAHSFCWELVTTTDQFENQQSIKKEKHTDKNNNILSNSKLQIDCSKRQ